MGDGVLAHFDADIAAAHFLSDGSGRARAEERVENQIAGVSCDVNYPLNQTFRFRSHKILASKKRDHLFLGFLGVSNVRIQPQCLRHNTLFDLTQKPFNSRSVISIGSPPDPLIKIHFCKFFRGHSPIHSIRRSGAQESLIFENMWKINSLRGYGISVN